MIINASRRTDIPAYYSDWFFNRLRDGFVMVRDPRSPHLVRKAALTLDVVDGLVLWTKNPIPMLGRLRLLANVPFYFQFSLTPYGQDIEPCLPNKLDLLIPAFRDLARSIGPERVIWRYDPILLLYGTATSSYAKAHLNMYSFDWHARQFNRLASLLEGYSKKAIVSFVDTGNIHYRANPKINVFEAIKLASQRKLMSMLAPLAQKHGFSLATCAEAADFSEFGVGRAHCVDKDLLGAIGGCELEAGKDPAQKEACGCHESLDIGEYGTCPYGCEYCYAGGDSKLAAYVTVPSVPRELRRLRGHYPDSPLLWGRVQESDEVVPVIMKSLKKEAPPPDELA